MNIQAFNLSRAHTGFFLTAVDAVDLFPLCRVERVSANPVDGFQRQLDAPRARRISKYLQDRVIPGAIVLSAKSSHPVSFNETTGILTISDELGSLLVIDGQHRLYGSWLAATANPPINIKLPVCILTDLSLMDEVQYFLDINSTAKGVPKTLRIELTKFIAPEDSIEAIRLKLFSELNTEPDSVLCGKLSAESKGPGYLSHVPFELALNKVLGHEKVRYLEYSDKKALLKNYLSGVYANLLELDLPQKLTQSAFFQAIFRVFEKAYDNAMLYKRNLKAEAFEYVFEAILRINFDLHTGTNDEAINALEKDLIDTLDMDKKSKISSDLF